MVTAVLLMLLTGSVWAAVGALFGAAPTEKDRLYSFFSTSGIIFCIFALAVRTPAAAPTAEILRLATLMVPSALLDTIAFLMLKIAMERGSQGLGWSIVQSALVVPFVFLVAFMGNPAAAAQWIGLVSVLTGLALLGLEKPNGGTRDTTYFRLVFAAFAILGVALCLRLIPGYWGFSDEAMTWRLPLHALATAAFWTVVCAARRRWRPIAVWKQAVPYGLVVALGQTCFYLATDAADKLLLTSIVMPVSIGTCILLFALYCHVFRGERLSPVGWAAIALDIAGIALLSCGGPAAN